MPLLGLIKKSHHSWLSKMMSPEGPPFQPCLGFPNLSPPLNSGKYKTEQNTG